MNAVSGSPASSGRSTRSTCGPTRFAPPPQEIGAVRLRRELVPLHRGVGGTERGAEVARRGAHPGEAVLQARNIPGIVEDLFFGKAGKEIDELRLL